MDVHKRLKQLMKDCGWSEYRLSKECGLSESTLANIFRRNTMPSISTLESICTAFGITLSQFFCENESVELTPELTQLFEGWKGLTQKQKSAVLELIAVMNNK
ncbi:MAG: helix-turn-helix transcriptional regulator [Oscillospiraceae bacterium]|nr:helix-turn-helix transcriptional regulator [Oscillospiraceae bacterium]